MISWFIFPLRLSLSLHFSVDEGESFLHVVFSLGERELSHDGADHLVDLGLLIEHVELLEDNYILVLFFLELSVFLNQCVQI